MSNPIFILGIESSCDETACAIVDDKKNILASSVWSQFDEHRNFGGVVPEIAARAHLQKCDILIQEVLNKAQKKWQDLSGISVAGGPGLIGGVLVGVVTGKTLAFCHNLPFLAVNHLEGHALTVRLQKEVSFPYLLLLTSGGHCQILVVEDVGKYIKLGSTIDDSAGECFDKVAKMLEIGYPGGPALEKYAEKGNEKEFSFPVPMKGHKGCDFSFSGLKTAVRVCVEKLKDTLTEEKKANICASFQKSVIEEVKDRLERAIPIFKERYPQGKNLVVAGGVAANKALRAELEKIALKYGLVFQAPDINLCTDNGVMIAWAGLERFKKGFFSEMDFKARPRWPLDTE